MSPDAGRGVRSTLLLALATWGFLAFLTTRSTLWDRDEPRFAQATVEMIASGDYLVPTFDRELRPDKPILIYWLMSVPVRIFGATEWTVRFFAPLGVALAGLLTAFLGRRLLGPRAGLLAMAMLVTTPIVIAEGSAATVDAVLLACTTAAIAVFGGMLERGPRVSGLVLLALALALAQLAKGPVGLVLPGLAMLATLIALRGAGWSRAQRLGVLLAALASAALFAAWFLPANAATGGELLRRAFDVHVVDRILSPVHGREGTYLAGLLFYAPILAIGCLPWTSWVGAGISALLGGRIGTTVTRALLLSWIGTCLAFMTLVATKRAHYVMPAWPALALVAAGAVEAAEKGCLDARDRRWLARGAWIHGVALAVTTLGLLLAPDLLSFPRLRGPLWTVAAAIGITGALALRDQARSRPVRSAVVALAGAWGAVACGALLVLPVLEEAKATPRIAAVIRARVPPEVPVARFGYPAPSLDFYLGRPPIEDFDSPERLADWAGRSGPGVLISTRARIEEHRGRLTPAVAEIAAASGFNYEKGAPIELVALGRNLPPR